MNPVISPIMNMEDVCFAYAHEPIFSQIGFLVLPGDFTAIIGANGTGKSTLVKLLIREKKPASGTIQWFGEPIGTFKAWQKIGYVPQHNLLTGNAFPATVAEVVQANLFAEVGFLRFPNTAHKARTMEALASVGMADFAKRLIGNLSGGQQQKVLLARALVARPVVLLLDEPTAGVDEASCEAIYSLLGQLNQQQNMTILMITHDVERTRQHAKKVLTLHKGQLVESMQQAKAGDAL